MGWGTRKCYSATKVKICIFIVHMVCSQNFLHTVIHLLCQILFYIFYMCMTRYKEFSVFTARKFTNYDIMTLLTIAWFVWGQLTSYKLYKDQIIHKRPTRIQTEATRTQTEVMSYKKFLYQLLLPEVLDTQTEESRQTYFVYRKTLHPDK